MGRPIYSYELGDPDFCWLMSNFQENYPNYSFSDTSNLPVVFIKTQDEEDFIASSEVSEEFRDEESTEIGDPDHIK